MELSAVGESVFAAESIMKRRIRRVLLRFSTHRLRLRALLRNRLFCAAAADKSCDNLNVLRIYLFFFAGSLGISRQMERLVSEVSRINEAGKDSAPSWPLAQLQHVSLPSLFGSPMFPRFITALVCRNTASCVSVGLIYNCRDWSLFVP